MKTINANFLFIPKNGILKLLLIYIYKEFQISHDHQKDYEICTKIQKIQKSLSLIRPIENPKVKIMDSYEDLAAHTEVLDVFKDFKDLLEEFPDFKEISIEGLDDCINYMSPQDVKDLKELGVVWSKV